MSLAAVPTARPTRRLTTERAKLGACARLAVALSRELDGRLVSANTIAIDAATFIEAVSRFADARSKEDLADMARVAERYRAIVSPPKGRGPVRVHFESGRTFEGIPGVFLVV